MDISCVSSLKMYVVWILSKWVDYGNSPMWPKWFVWIKHVSKWVYESILSKYAKCNIKKCVGLIMGWFLCISVKIRCTMGNQMFYGF